MPEPIGNAKFITELDIRIFLRDTDPEANLLIKDLEYSPEEIRQAMTMVVDQWNETPPSLRPYNINTFPFRYHYTLGTAANLLSMSAHRFRRNVLANQIAGGSVSDQDKAGPYEAAAARIGGQFAAWMRHKKIEMNARGAWGAV